MLDQKPVRSLFVFPLAHPGQDPATMELLTLPGEIQLALLIGALRTLAGPIAAIPNHDVASAILAFRNGPFEIALIQRMVPDLDCKPLVM
jgi:hypothetical protein